MTPSASDSRRGRRGRFAIALAVACLVAAPAAALASAPKAHTASGTVLETHKVSGGYGDVLAASNGHTLYGFENDGANKSRCTGTCAKTWKPYLASGKVSVKSGSGLKAKLLGTAKLSGGHLQVTYDKHPLYEYSKEHSAGETMGQFKNQFGGNWYMVNVKGGLITCQPHVVCGY